MKWLCGGLVFAGLGVLILSIIQYGKSLAYIKSNDEDGETFNAKMFYCGLALMVFFALAYLAVGIGFLTAQTINSANLLISVVFLLGSGFVFIMVAIEKRMTRTIFHKTGEIVRTLVNAMEAKDKYTRGHSDHVLNITRLLYNTLPEHIKSKINLTRLMDAAILHDIGKIGIDDQILNKTGALTQVEWETIRQHPNMGKDILMDTSYQDIGDIIRLHHERMDGKGYYGVAGEDIPLESRIIAISDTFSALYTNRVYRSKQDFDHAMKTLNEAKGTQLDRELVEIFITLSKEDLDAAGYIFSEQISYLR